MVTNTSLKHFQNDLIVYGRQHFVNTNRVYDYVELPKGSIKKLIVRELSWNDEPVELK